MLVTGPPPRPFPAIRKPSGPLAAPRRGARGGRRFSPGSAPPSTVLRREAEIEHHRRDRQRDVHRQPPTPGVRVRPRAGSGRAVTCGPATPRASASSRIRSARGSIGAVNRVPEPRRPGSGGVDRTRDVAGATAVGFAARGDGRLRLLEHPRALLGGAEDHRSAPEDAGRDRPLERARVGGQRHPGGNVGGHHPVLGDRDQHQVEEVPLLLGGLAPGEEEVEVLGEAERPIRSPLQVAAPHLHAVGVGLRDVADGLA